MRTVAAALAMAGVWIVAIDTASATTPPECSCAAFPIVADSVGRASVAFVGTPLTSEDVDDAEVGPATLWRVQVDEAIKGDLATVVEVYSDEVSERCGVALHLDVRVGIVPQVAAGGRLRVGECGDVVQPGDLTALADEELPEPEGRGPLAGMVAARAGPVGLIAVDAQFVPLGYVASEGDAVAAAPCPSGDTVAFLAASRSEVTVTTIRLETLEVIAEATIPADPAMIAQRGAAEVFCTSDEGDASVLLRTSDGATLWSVDAAADIREIALPGAVDAAAAGIGLYVLTPENLTLVGPDGGLLSAPATFVPDAAALSMVLDGWDLVVAVSNDLSAGRFVADELRRFSLLDGSTVSQALDEPVGAPILRAAPNGIVIASAFGGETWYSHDGRVIEGGNPNVWPAGDGFVSWTEGTTGATAILGGEEVGVLEFASNPTFVLALDSAVTVDPESPGATAMSMIPTPGRILTPATIPAASAETTTAATIVATSTSASAVTAPSTTERDGRDLGSSTVFGAAIVGGVALVLIAAAIALRRRNPAIDPPQP